MIPLRDSTPSRSFPLVTVLIILANIYVFYQQITSGPVGMEAMIYQKGFIPSHLLYHPTSAVTYMFLHGSLMHIISNMWMLWLLGDNVEDRMGKMRFIIFYLLCGIIAALVHYYINPHSSIPVVGASGAIAGVMGAYFIMFPRARILTWVPPFFLFTFPAWFYLGIWILTQLWAGLGSLAALEHPTIAFWAHIGGFAAGVILHPFFVSRENTDHYY
ncbi:Membrane associated serine protease, rhomboid family [Thermosyntropha lipolytica DSM 11003]|uniref:Membrane associated serine protease, rhomboid family n=1 Tax=Thermosyntropha lipolytica DSM 11003 TaxID=1123382 RepID=A0A1M5KMZ2_9FIRM|nr:rhomboid family intramembrane serine protease [Thermosyntropha lipolytica]SHG54125.1 Membrane associated serine protease, rhomboid family [Thermosyntropha lipolytica DSM 11003]